MGGWLIGAGTGAVAALAALALWQLRADREAAPAREDGRFVLAPSRAMGSVAAILGLVALGFLAGLAEALVRGPSAADWVLGVAAAVSAGAFLWVLRRRRVRVTYDEDGLGLIAPGRPVRSFAWAELSDIHRETRRAAGAPAIAQAQIVARAPDGGVLRVPGNLTGFSHFAAHALKAAERHGVRGADRDA